MTVDEIIQDIIKKEGGYVNNKSDRGGPTKYGITQATLSTWLGRRATIEDVKKLTKEQATKIYYNKYYLDTKIDKLPKEIQHIIFDITVNSWIKVATIILQKSINSLNDDSAIIIDGRLGIQTINAANRLIAAGRAKDLINRIVDLRIDFYNSIVDNNKSQAVFLAGWLNRANSFRA